jgi:hypothetical protein
MVKLVSLSVVAVAVVAAVPSFAKTHSEEAPQPDDLVTAERVFGGNFFEMAMGYVGKLAHGEDSDESKSKKSPPSETSETSTTASGKPSTPAAPEPAPSPAPGAPTHQARELTVDQGLYERSVNEELYERGLAFDAEEFYAREPEYEELMSRGYYDEQDLYSRELYDEQELYGREYYDEGMDLYARGYYDDRYLD